MFCQYCGKTLEEGEVCNCHPVEQENTNDEKKESVSSLPQGSEIASNAKKLVKNVSKNPVVTDVMNVFKGSVINPVKTVYDCAKRTDILWMILSAVEILVMSLASMIFTRRIGYVIISSIAKKGNVDDENMKYSLYANFLSKDLEITCGGMFATNLLTNLITFVVAVILFTILLAICKKKISFSSICNVLSVSNLPSVFLSLIAIIFSFIYAPLAIPFFLASFFIFVVQTYLGMQKLEEFTTSPIWLYIAFIVLLLIISFVCTIRINGEFYSEIFDGILEEIIYY